MNGASPRGSCDPDGRFSAPSGAAMPRRHERPDVRGGKETLFSRRLETGNPAMPADRSTAPLLRRLSGEAISRTSFACLLSDKARNKFILFEFPNPVMNAPQTWRLLWARTCAHSLGGRELQASVKAFVTRWQSAVGDCCCSIRRLRMLLLRM